MHPNKMTSQVHLIALVFQFFENASLLSNARSLTTQAHHSRTEHIGTHINRLQLLAVQHRASEILNL